MSISVIFLICLFVLLGIMLAAFIYGAIKLAQRAKEDQESEEGEIIDG